MSVTLGSGITSVTGNVTSVQSKVAATCVNTRRTTAGTTTMGTVGANKVWRILSITLGSANIASAATTNPNVLLNGVPALFINMLGTAAVSGGMFGSVTWNYGACPVLTTGQTIQHITDQTSISDACVSYVEETV